MDSYSPNESRRIPSPQHQSTGLRTNGNLHEKGRVRTGCLVCRARKVKCDEHRPNCRNCLRLKKPCVYKRQKQQRPSPTTPVASGQGENGPGLVYGQQFSSAHQPDATIQAGDDALISAPYTSNNNFDTFNQMPAWAVSESSSTRFHLTSQHILLALAMDLGPSDPSSPPSFSYFIEEVDCPIISSFDPLIWRRVKLHVAQLGLQQSSVAMAILAVQALYRAQVDRLPMSHALSLYQTATTNLESIANDSTVNFDIILVITFLLFVCAVTIPNEDSSALGSMGDTVASRLETWLLSGNHNHSPISLRICAWLQFLDTATKHVGNVGLLPGDATRLLRAHIVELPSMPLLLDRDNNNDQPIPLADLSHYRRSRITPADQAEVTEIFTDLNSAMSLLWEKRPDIMRHEPNDIRENFSRAIADPLITLVGICKAAYFGEIVDIGRTLGDPPLASAEAIQAMARIRDIVDDGDWNVFFSTGGALHAGYLRPLFLCAIEHPSKQDAQWAVSRLRKIRAPLSRSDFLMCFAESLGEAQRKEERRITTKYFCYQKFGVPLPFM